jgi:succinate-semialdehyde dehydrogenase/glutarate-semialdehyde dehydrogenase
VTAQAAARVGRARAEAEAKYPQLASVIGGQRVSGSSRVPVFDPTTGRELGALPLVDATDVTRALATASEAFGTWSACPPTQGRDVLHGTATLLRQRAVSIAQTITLELGKPLDQAQAEVELACQVIDFNAEEACRGFGRVIPGPDPEDLTRRLVVYEPVGPVAAFSSWNAPLLTPSRKVSSALAAGCSVLLKPAEQTPATVLFLIDALTEAGVPPGVADVVFGDPIEVSEQVLTHPAIRAVTFTGSTAIGRQVAARASGQLKRLVVELGGHAPVIVMPDVDVEIANRLPVGLAGYVFTNDSRALRAITSGLNCGAIAVNHWTVSGPETPFGGRGDSGHGIEGGWEGVAAFRQQKFVSEA